MTEIKGLHRHPQMYVLKRLQTGAAAELGASLPALLGRDFKGES